MSSEGAIGQDLAPYQTAFGCSEDLAKTIAELGRRSIHARGAQLWPIPDRDETTLLLKGLAQEVVYGREGAMLVLTALGPGDLYGGLVGAGGTDAQIEAISDGAGAHFASSAVVRMMESYSTVAVAIARQLSARLAAMRLRMVEAAMLSATGRIAAELLRRAGSSETGTISPMPVFAELAVSVQSTRETVSRTISQWERRGLVSRVPEGLRVVAPHRLEELVY